MKQWGIFRWLAPGIRIKRWFLLFGIGVSLLMLGFFLMIDYRWLTWIEDWLLKMSFYMTGSYDYQALVKTGVVAILLGVFIMYWGARKMVKTIVHAIIPDEGNQVSDYIFQNLRLGQGPKIVVIGGGTGLSTLLRGLKTKTSNITAIVTVADDGGSSGRLREDLQMVAPGDLRNCLVALAETEGLMKKLFRYRFGDAGNLSGHSFGNLFLAALTQVLDDDIEGALEASSKILKVRGRVIPATTEKVVLSARMADGTVVRGESQIPKAGQAISRVFMEPGDVHAEGAALQAIDDADVIILGPGSLYTSVIPNILIENIRDHIRAAKAKKLYICNVMTQNGETTGYTVADHVEAIIRHGGKGLVDMVLANDLDYTAEQLEEAASRNTKPVRIDDNRLRQLGVRVVRANLTNKENEFTHDPMRLSKVIMDIVYAMQSDVDPRILEYYLQRQDH